MKVKKLIEELKKFDPETDVVLQKDPEGNGYSLAAGAEAVVVTQDGYGFNVYDLQWTAEQCGLEEDEWEKLKQKKDAQAIVLYPIY